MTSGDKACDFCGRTESHVVLLIEKPGNTICNNCVNDFVEQLQRPSVRQEMEEHSECAFCSFLNDELTTETSDLDRLLDLNERNPEMAFNMIMGAYRGGSEPESSGQTARRTVKGPKCSICSDCLMICKEIISEHTIGRG